MWSVSEDRGTWYLSDAGELEIIHALFELMAEHKGTVRVEASAGGTEIVFAFRFTGQRPVLIYPPMRYGIGNMLSLQVEQTLSWDQKLRIQGAPLSGRMPLSTALSTATISGGSIEAVLPRPVRAFE